MKIKYSKFSGKYYNENNIEVIDILPNYEVTIFDAITPEEIEAVELSKIPQILTPRQFWLSVYEIKGLKKSNILTEMENLDEPPRVTAQITLIDALQFERQDPLLNQLAETFGVSQEDLNDIFINGIEY